MLARLKSKGDNEEDIIKELNDIMKNSNDIKIGVLIEHKTDANQYLFKADYFGILSDLPTEEEILRVGNDVINCTWEIEPNTAFTVFIPMLLKYADRLDYFKQQ